MGSKKKKQSTARKELFSFKHLIWVQLAFLLIITSIYSIYDNSQPTLSQAQTNPSFSRVLGTIDSNDGEIPVPSDTENQSVVVTLKTPEIAPPAVNEAESVEIDTEAIEQVQDTVIERNEDLLRPESVKTYEFIPAFSADVTDEDIDELEADPLVESVELNNLRFLSLDDSVPLINADDVHTGGYDGSDVAVAILDTGVQTSHVFVDVVSEACYSNANGFGGGTSLCPGGGTSQIGAGSGVQCSGVANCNHGTHVGGIAAGTGNGETFSGVAKGTQIISIQVFTRYDGIDCFFAGSDPCLGATTSDIISGLNRVLALHNDAGFTSTIASANLSLGGGLYNNQITCDNNNTSTKTAIDSLRAAGIATIMASGNDSDDEYINSPGCISTGVAVGSTTKADAISGFSNSNSMVDLLAPGSSIYSSIPTNSFATFSGTSMATPHVTGAWALLKDKYPNASVDDILSAFQNTGVEILDARNGITIDRIDVDAAISAQVFVNISVLATDTKSSEGGGTAKVQFSLAQMPTADVTIPLSVSDGTEASLASGQIVIAAADWDTPANNQVIITGVDDSEQDGDVSYNLVTGDPTSGDADFDALGANDVADVALKNIDNEHDIGFGGDWDKDNKDEIGLKRGNKYFLNYQNDGKENISFNYGLASDFPFGGDWDKDNRDEVALQRGNKFLLNYHHNSNYEVLFKFGISSDYALGGDWDKDKRDEVALKRGNKFFLNYGNNGGEEVSFRFGRSSDFALAGDWDGDGRDEIALKRGNKYFLNFGNDGREEVSFRFGKASDLPIAGDWDKDGKDEIGLQRGNRFFLNFGNDGKEEVSFTYGR